MKTPQHNADPDDGGAGRPGDGPAEAHRTVVRKLWRGERDELKAHFLRLRLEDRRMRFCGSASDEVIAAYCDRIDWLRTVVLGLFVDGRLCGAAEVVPVGGIWVQSAELALTVEEPFQSRGYGTELLRKALVIARNRFVGTVYMICLPENVRMQRIAQKLGANLAVGEGEVEGRIWPSWPSYLSLAEEVATEGHALVQSAFDLTSASAIRAGR